MQNKQEIIENFKTPEDNSYNSYFTYPRGGAIQYVNALYDKIDSSKVSVRELKVELILTIKK